MSTAREVLARILLFGIVPGGVLAALFMTGQTVLPAAFTTDAAVIAAVAHVVPLLALCMVCAMTSSRSIMHCVAGSDGRVFAQGLIIY